MNSEYPRELPLALEVEVSEPNLFREEEWMASQITGADWDNIQARIKLAQQELRTQLLQDLKPKRFPEWLIKQHSFCKFG